jgi:hypothetical protein
MPHGILRVFLNTILYENVFQNPELFPTQVSLSPKQSTLATFMQITIVSLLAAGHSRMVLFHRLTAHAKR